MPDPLQPETSVRWRKDGFCARCGAGVIREQACGQCGDDPVTHRLPATPCDRCGEPGRASGRFCARCGYGDWAAHAAVMRGRGAAVAMTPTPAQAQAKAQADQSADLSQRLPQPTPAKRRTGAGKALATIGWILIIALWIGSKRWMSSQRVTTTTPGVPLSKLPAMPAPMTRPTFPAPDWRREIDRARDSTLPAPAPGKPGLTGALDEVMSVMGTFDADGWYGARFSARCRLAGGGRGKLVARALTYPAGKLVTTAESPFTDADGSGGEASVVIPYDPLRPTAGQNVFYVELSVIDAGGVERARGPRSEVPFEESTAAVRRVRAFAAAADATARKRGMRFVIDMAVETGGGASAPRAAAGIRFHLPTTGAYVRTTNRGYADEAGNVVAWAEPFMPPAPPATTRTVVRGVELFVPYDVLPAAGTQLRAEVSLWDMRRRGAALAEPAGIDVTVAGR